MRLLAIQELPQSKRVKLVFDDDTVLKTQPYLLADFGLYSGMELTEEDYQALLAAAGKASAKARAVRIVAAAGVSEKELQKRLVRKGEEAADAQEAVGCKRGQRRCGNVRSGARGDPVEADDTAKVRNQSGTASFLTRLLSIQEAGFSIGGTAFAFIGGYPGI